MAVRGHDPGRMHEGAVGSGDSAKESIRLITGFSYRLENETSMNKSMSQAKPSVLARWPVAILMTAMASSAVVAETADAPGQAHHGKTADEVAKELANPNNDLARLSFKNQYRWYKGDLPGADDQDNYTLLFQPIFPFSLGTKEDGTKQTFFLRPAIPVVFNQPVPEVDNGQFDWAEKTAMGDWGFDAAYAETTKSGFLWAAGMVGTLPVATDSAVAGKQLRLGPEALFAQITKVGTFGIFPSHQWNVTGWGSGESNAYSTTAIQPLIIFTPGGGWQIASKGIIDYDWINEQWTVPVALSVAKTVMLDGKPWQFELEVNYYADQPDAFGPEWMVSFNVTPVVNNFIEAAFKGK